MRKILIKNTNFINKDFELTSKKDILIEDGIIKKIGKISDKGLRTFDGKNFLLTSGFINAHFHLGETIFRGNADLTSLKHYLKYTSSFENYLKTFRSHEIISEISLIEAMKSGTSVISCSRGWDVTKRSGIRGSLGFPIMNSKKLRYFYKNFETMFEIKKRDFPFLFNSGNVQIKLDLWVHSLNALDNKILRLVSRKFSESADLNLTIHIAETKDQVNRVKKRFGKSEVQVLMDYGLLNERVNLVHVNHVSNKDIKLIANKGANITICPISNLLLNSGLPNLRTFLEHNINVSIGTDGLATNGSASLLESAKVTFLLYRNIVKLTDIFKMISINPAKTLGFDKCGFIDKGYYADINFYDITNSNLFPKENILANLILSPSLFPRHVMVDGIFVVKNYKPVKIDEKESLNNFERLSKKIQNEIHRSV